MSATSLPADPTSEIDALLIETIDRVCSEQADRETRERAEQGHWPAELWSAFAGIGLTILRSPSFTLRGGTREILRGMIARGLGLR